MLLSDACLVAALLFSSTAAFAQTSSSSPDMTPATGSMTGSSSSSMTGDNTNLMLGSKIMNCHVKNQQGEELGTISNLVVNPNTGHIRYVVVSSSGKKVAVPWNALTAKNTENGQTPHFVVNTTKQKMAGAPKFDPNNLSSLSNRTAEEPIFTYYELIWFPDVQSPEEQKASGSSTSSTGGSSPYATATPSGGTTPDGGNIPDSTMPTTGSTPDAYPTATASPR
ncbi:MAG: PRC-barrel domain-containing protein [Chthoniobacterales bacterium]